MNLVEALRKADEAVTNDDVLDAIEALARNSTLTEAHEQWWDYDERWKIAQKNAASDPEILGLAALTRESKKWKDYVFDKAAAAAGGLAHRFKLVEYYDGDTLGSATKIDEVQELSPQWHDLRKTGIGGSSISGLLGFHWMSRNGNPKMMDGGELDDHWMSMCVGKSSTFPENEYPEIPSEGVLYRGHVWEDALLAKYVLESGDRVAVSKATWAGPEDYQVVNLDGIILDDSGTPQGIVECKTASRDWVWDQGVPLNYRAQVLWYLHATGLDYAIVVVKFDSGFFEKFTIWADETLDGTDRTKKITEYLERIERRWNSTEKFRRQPELLWEQLEDLAEEEDAVDPYLNDDRPIDMSGFPVVQLKVIAPFERMDERFNQLIEVSVLNKGTVGISGVSPIFYDYAPYSEYIDESDIIDFISDDDLPVIATDTVTYNELSHRYPALDIVHASAIRRITDNSPGSPDFPNASVCQKWLLNNK